jgi:repressor LexA
MKEICQRIYDYIKESIAYEGTPSVRDICEALGIKSTSTVHKYLNELEEAGMISRSNNKHRYITLTQSPGVPVPVYGTIPAGQPITAIEEIDGYIPVSDYRGDYRELFGLKVHGESMINAGILDGDIVILRQTPYAENGQIVAAMIGDEATLKRFYKENGRFRLQPENDAMAPIYADEVVILGVIVASYRRYEE